MGQKTHPYAFRIGIVNDWKSRWFSDKDYTKLVNQDYRIREFLSSQLIKGAVSRIDIERTRDKVQVDIHTARPGVVIGRKGAEADRLRKGLEDLSSQPVKLNIIEVREPELDAQLLARAVADQLESRVAFRRAMKRAVTGALKAGDFIKFANHTKVYMIVSDHADISTGTITIEPPLKSAISSQDITYDSVPITVRLVSDLQEFKTNSITKTGELLFTYEIDVSEAF